MPSLPVLFISHGAPTLVIEPHPARDFLAGLATELVGVRAVLAVTAHWTTREPCLSAVAQPDTIHDFGGFPASLYALRYPAPGAPAVAAAAQALLAAAGLAAHLDGGRGLDHGTWVPLMLMAPDAHSPVVQLSVQPGRDAAYHWAVGQALQPLRRQGVLVLASGATTHNLAAYFAGDDASAEPAWVTDFAEWLAEHIEAGDTAALLDYREQAPAAARNHPTDEHLLPLFVALGAAATAGRRIHVSTDHAVLRMDAYRWE